MDSENEPSAKRRRLSDGVTTVSTFPFSNYLVLGFVEVPVEPDLSGLAESFPANSNVLPVSLKKATRLADGLEIAIAAERPRVAKTVTATNLAERARQVLEDSAKLDSIFIASKKPGLLLACSHASLSIRQSQLYLEVRILWQDTAQLNDKVDIALLEILRRYLPNMATQASLVPEIWEPREFYDNVHVPANTPETSAEIKIDQLQSQLYPFQRRTVRWMLSREGVAINSAERVTPIEKQAASSLPRGFAINRDCAGGVCYVNHALGVVSSNFAEVRQKYDSIIGGLLADEMGLGKTLGVISTVCLHPRPDVGTEPGIGQLRKSGATLIITPPTILEQWKQEIHEHAPSLRVFHYEGIKPSKENLGEAVDKLVDNDIVLTTYNVISKEVHYVVEKPDRNLRKRPRVEPPKSPLTEISWWRVCLDEAQMVESGVSAAATVAKRIPRINAWAVTGTPLRKGHRDLFGLLIFLRYEPWSHSGRLWDTLISYYRPLFRSMINEVAIRHNKDFVREDLRLPPQSRHTITIPFTAVEEQHYDQLFGDMCEACGLDRAGAPQNDDWDPDSASTIDKLRTWLTRLRQTCLHPEVGVRNRKALGRSGGPLRTVQQVLDVMIEQNESLIRTEQRNWLMSRIRRGQMQENAKDTQAAMAIWKAAYDESCEIVEECRSQLQAEIAIQTASDQAQAKDDNTDSGDDTEIDSQLQTLRQRLRSALEVKHICIFFMANAYFQLKSDETTVKPESEEFLSLEKSETQAYEEAKAIRGELLVEVLRKANRLINNVRSKASSDTLSVIPQMEAPTEYNGIESRKVFDKLFDYCEAMNSHTKYFESLRRKMIDFLQQALIDEDEGIELQGDEYESSTKHQDEMYAYMEALRALFADRGDALNGQENLLIRQEMKQFLRLAKAGEGPAAEVMLKLLAEREEKRVKVSEKGSLRGIVAEIRQLVTALQWQEAGGSIRARTELVIANRILQHAQQLVTVQTKALSGLEQEVNLFRETMNSRLDYYRALQKISDTVAPFDEEHVGQPLNQTAYRTVTVQEQRVSDKVSTLLSKRRYLLHLKTESSSQSPRLCTICQSEFDIGTLTVCGHQFCKECIQLWWNEHRNCPVCKRRLHTIDFHDITYKPAEMVVQAESPQSSFGSPVANTERTHNQSIYSDISTGTLNEIKNIDLQGSSFGSKVDMLARHVLWLREHDPGTKAIVFSQYREFLDVLGRAFKQHRIACSFFDEKNGIEKFKTDPAIECFLLHAKAHSAGLNLVVASHVFLCEPLLATAVELQAIARVHRIGQHRATTVWMYIIGGSVEESIYDISVARRLAHIKRAVKTKGKSRLDSTSASGTDTPNNTGLQENAIDAANSLELQAADLSKLLTSGRSGGELVEKEDLWQCLFGRAKKKETLLEPESQPAGGEVGKFLRGEAAESRKLVSRGREMPHFP